MEEERAGLLPDIPERREALPPAGGRTVTKEEALRRIADLKAILQGNMAVERDGAGGKDVSGF